MQTEKDIDLPVGFRIFCDIIFANRKRIIFCIDDGYNRIRVICLQREIIGPLFQRYKWDLLGRTFRISDRLHNIDFLQIPTLF